MQITEHSALSPVPAGHVLFTVDVAQNDSMYIEEIDVTVRASDLNSGTFADDLRAWLDSEDSGYMSGLRILGWERRA